MSNYSYTEIDVCYMANGHKLSLPVHTLSGNAGPTIGFSAAIHGDEIIGVEILRRVLNILKEQDLQGTVKIMSVANPLAFEVVNRNTPIDGGNLNRTFPGYAQGMITDKLAYLILEEFAYHLDAFCDIHSGGREPMVDYVYIQNDEAMSRSFGSKVLYRPAEDYIGTISGSLKEKGIACMTVEIGGSAIREEDIQRGVDGVLNVLRHKGILAGEVQAAPEQIVVTHIENCNPQHGGIMVPALTAADMGTIIKGKQLLAQIYNPKTYELLEEIYTPYQENLIILCRPSLNRCFPGDFSFMIGEMATAE